ncbi:leucine-rich repeat-containing protein 51 [Halyomorpha halys]|uniref:leucine-rich repeat-containing protein 51 n=1 Tax=Halyomorpha halys TaxID=286706 RepID=UPI0006D52705|nr:leucine-rich repeat-containing protein 51-like [Halyomorpha halys]
MIEQTDLVVNDNVDVSLTSPADYSFRKIKSLYMADRARPRSMRIGKEVIRGPNDKIVSNSLWLNHNNLESFNGLVAFCNKIFEAPSKIKWLDLSFNGIEEISEEILKFKELQILYLHGNCIDNMLDILKLKTLKNLKTLTLHGCPIETVPFYRQKMVYLLPQVKNLDFVTITPREAVAPAPPGARELLKVYEEGK